MTTEGGGGGKRIAADCRRPKNDCKEKEQETKNQRLKHGNPRGPHLTSQATMKNGGLLLEDRQRSGKGQKFRAANEGDVRGECWGDRTNPTWEEAKVEKGSESNRQDVQTRKKGARFRRRSRARHAGLKINRQT